MQTFATFAKPDCRARYSPGRFDLDHFAPQATLELQELFSEWLRATGDRVLDLIVKKTTDTAAIAAVLKLSEPSVRYILNPPRRSRQDHTERGSGKVGGIFPSRRAQWT